MNKLPVTCNLFAIVVLSSIPILVSGQACIVPALCNSGPFSLFGNLVGNTVCLLECTLACGVGSTGICNSYNGTTVYLGPDLFSRPTKAQCQCHPPPGGSCLQNPADNIIAGLWIAIYDLACPDICKACHGTGGVGTYDPANYTFTCTCQY